MFPCAARSLFPQEVAFPKSRCLNFKNKICLISRPQGGSPFPQVLALPKSIASLLKNKICFNFPPAGRFLFLAYRFSRDFVQFHFFSYFCTVITDESEHFLLTMR